MKSLSEIGLPHLPLHFDIFFDSLLLKCNSNSFKGFTRGSLKRIYPSDVAWLSEPERTAAWLTAARLSLVVASYLSMILGVCDFFFLVQNLTAWKKNCLLTVCIHEIF